VVLVRGDGEHGHLAAQQEAHQVEIVGVDVREHLDILLRLVIPALGPPGFDLDSRVGLVGHDALIVAADPVSPVAVGPHEGGRLALGAPSLDSLPRPAHTGVEALHVADTEVHPCLGRGIDHAPALRHRHAQGLLKEHVLAGAEQVSSHGSVGGVGQDGRHGIDLVILSQFPVVLVDPLDSVPRGNLRRHVLPRIGHGHHLAARQRAEVRNMGDLAHEAAAHEAHPDFLHTDGPSRRRPYRAPDYSSADLSKRMVAEAMATPLGPPFSTTTLLWPLRRASLGTGMATADHSWRTPSPR